jgi:hypothetical protein
VRRRVEQDETLAVFAPALVENAAIILRRRGVLEIEDDVLVQDIEVPSL